MTNPNRTQAATTARVVKMARRRHERWAEEMRAWGCTVTLPAEHKLPQA